MTATSHSGRNVSLIDQTSANTLVDFASDTTSWKQIAQGDNGWWDTTTSKTTQTYLIMYNQQKIKDTLTDTSTQGKDLTSELPGDTSSTNMETSAWSPFVPPTRTRRGTRA